MAKQLGRDMLVKIGDGEASEAFATLCGLTSKGLTINNAPIDVTTPDCTTPGGVLWRETLTGVKSLSITGTGLFEDSVSEARLNTVAMSATARANFQVIVPAFGTYAGSFTVTSAEYGGEMEGGVTYGLTLESAGTITFTAAA
jgi:TP901-1 family phage major tail protein